MTTHLDERQRCLLARARKLIDTGWCQDGFAINEDGRVVSIHDKSAIKFCLVGALQRVCEEGPGSFPRHLNTDFLKVCERLEFLLPNGSLCGFNDVDGRTKEEVLELIDAEKDQPNNKEDQND